MPYNIVYCPAEVFMVHNGVTVYHVYKNDDPDQGTRMYWFDTNEDSQDEGGFDTRDLARTLGIDDNSSTLDEYNKRIIRAAIESGLLPMEE
jgi:hypothetical protein